MKDQLLSECEESILDFAKRKNMSPDQTLSKFQTALLNIAGWICDCYRYSEEEYEEFMRDYVNNVAAAVERRFRKE